MAMTISKRCLFVFLVLCCCVLSVQSRKLGGHNPCLIPRNINVLDYGAVGDGRTDDTKAFEDAWKATCKSRTCSTTMTIPSGKRFLLQPLTFNGNCKPNTINFQIDGELVAPSDPSDWKCHGERCKQWITFEEVDGLVIRGEGSINGDGSNWWHHSCDHGHHDKRVCGKKPTGFTISHCNNVRISDLTFKDSPQMHIAFERSTWVYASNLTIQAPGKSPNTDGIHIQHSQNVFIDHSHIGTGDDCVSIGDGSANIDINHIECGPGHGISVGSLGIHGERETVEHVRVSNVTFRETQNGVRIKTWQGGKGYARDFVFENIKSIDSKNPIIIDQFYCPHMQCNNQTSAVKISNITFDTIYGTSKTETAVTLACGDTVRCTDIVLKDINLVSSGKREGDEDIDTISFCSNVEGHANGTVYPAVACLS